MKKGWQWPVGIAVFLAIVVIANAIIVAIAVNDPSFAVEKDYYQRGLEWDKTMAQERQNGALGWKLDVTAEPGSPGENGRLVAKLVDRDGAPVDGASVDVDAFHNARANQVQSLHLAAAADHTYGAAIDLRRPGMWEFRFKATRGAETFTTTVTKDVDRP